MELKYTIIFLIVKIFSLTELLSAYIIQTPLGAVRGTVEKSINGSEFYSFKGIPFAEPPIGKLRFQKPLPKKPWDGIFEANQHTECVQASFFRQNTILGSEDCLVLSISVPKYFPENTKKSPLPVMVWIHGGGFTQGSGSPEMYGPERFMDYGVILVSINYRLGPFGFVSSGTEDIPGNQGIWDQIEALRWVKRNIAFFGGNPKQVTIFGESAGGMSVMGLYISKQAKGLFHKAIAQSGTTNGAFTTQHLHPKCGLEKIAQNTNCDTSKPVKDLLICLQEAKVEDFGAILKERTDLSDGFKMSPFRMADDSKFGLSIPTIFTSDPLKMMKNGDFNDVPLMIGANKDEGMAFINIMPISSLKKNIYHKGPSVFLGRAEEPTSKDTLDIMETISSWYFGSKDPAEIESNDNFIEKGAAILTDSWFIMPNILTSNTLLNKAKSPIYQYMYGHHGSFTFCDIVNFDWKKYIGKMFMRFFGSDAFLNNLSCHADEVSLLFKVHKIPIDGVYNSDDKIVSAKMLEMWTDFVKTSNPTPKTNLWMPMNNADKDHPQWLYFDSKTSEMKTIMTEMAMNWMNLYEKYPPLNYYALHDQCPKAKNDAFQDKTEL